jgi:xanthine dehydrogenase accessory factor
VRRARAGLGRADNVMKVQLLRMLQDWRAQKHPCAMVTHLASGAGALVGARMRLGDLELTDVQIQTVRTQIAADRSGAMEGDLFVRVYAPPLRLIVVGAVHIAKALAPMAMLAGFDVTVVDPREGFVRSEQMAGVTALVAWPDEAMSELEPDERTAIVTLTHDPKLDDPALASALRSSAFYIGALGSRKTHAGRIARLRDQGFAEADLARIHGPVGLDINALSPAEIAVSIVAQMIAVLRAEAA